MKFAAWILMIIIGHMAFKPCMGSICTGDSSAQTAMITGISGCCKKADQSCKKPQSTEENTPSSSDSDCGTTCNCYCNIIPLFTPETTSPATPSEIISDVPSYHFSYSFDHLSLIWHPPISQV